MRVSYTRLCSAETDSSKGLGATTETYTRVTAVHSTPWSIKTCHCIFDYVYFYFISGYFSWIFTLLVPVETEMNTLQNS